MLKIIVIALFCTYGFTQDYGPKEIFEDLVQEASEIIKDSEGQEDRVDYLSFQAGLRNRFFDLQALAQSFTEKYPLMRTFYRTSKRIEDQIGAYRQRIEELEGAIADGASQDLIDQLQAEADEQHGRLDYFLENKGWYNQEKIDLLFGILDEIQWDTIANEKRYIMLKLADRLKYLETTEYNMMILEGNGIHTIRKDVRWYLKEVKVFAAHEFVLTATNGGFVQNGACHVTRSHHNEMVQLYSHFGDIKDLGERLHAQGKKLPQKYHDEADERYQRLSNNGDQIFKKLKDDYLACADELK
jgi:uncharacterized protein YukE